MSTPEQAAFTALIERKFNPTLAVRCDYIWHLIACIIGGGADFPATRDLLASHPRIATLDSSTPAFFGAVLDALERGTERAPGVGRDAAQLYFVALGTFYGHATASDAYAKDWYQARSTQS